MLEIRRRAYPRAGLIGNPSDGYNGKTIAFSVKNYFAEVVLRESDKLTIFPTVRDESVYDDIHSLHNDISRHGYYGGIRLIKATIKVFVDYCQLSGQPLRPGNFSLSYFTNIPQQVGMAGSSAIIVATLRALMEFYTVSIEKQVQPSVVFSVESDELGIGGGLQDRVIQVYEGAVAMDFSLDAMTRIDRYDVGVYTHLDTDALPPLYIAYRPASSEPTEVFHNNLRERYNAGDMAVVSAMKKFVYLTERAMHLIESNEGSALGPLLDENFNLRQSMCKLNPQHVEMVMAARRTGVSAKYAGSGGAIVGAYRDDQQFGQLQNSMEKIGCILIKPIF